MSLAGLSQWKTIAGWSQRPPPPIATLVAKSSVKAALFQPHEARIRPESARRTPPRPLWPPTGGRQKFYLSAAGTPSTFCIRLLVARRAAGRGGAHQSPHMAHRVGRRAMMAAPISLLVEWSRCGTLGATAGRTLPGRHGATKGTGTAGPLARTAET